MIDQTRRGMPGVTVSLQGGDRRSPIRRLWWLEQALDSDRSSAVSARRAVRIANQLVFVVPVAIGVPAPIPTGSQVVFWIDLALPAQVIRPLAILLPRSMERAPGWHGCASAGVAYRWEVRRSAIRLTPRLREARSYLPVPKVAPRPLHAARGLGSMWP